MRLLGVAESAERVEAHRITMRCPVCLREGTLDQRGADLRVVLANQLWGQHRTVSGERRCPNPDCRALIYLIYKHDEDRVLMSFPAERIDFDASDLPDAVRMPLEEAIDCHAHGSFPAAAVMVRRTLEAICADQNTDGSNLYERIEQLGQAIVLPKGMVDALQNLRLLGNDAVHVEARIYAEVGKREVEVAVDVAKTILQATYQMETILGELESLKSTPDDD